MAPKNLVLYHYFEKDQSYRDNLLHFLAFGLDPSCDYVFIISGPYSIKLPALPNVRYVFTEVKRSDFGGYAQLINEGMDLSAYTHIFFINSSVRGPFIPSYCHQSWCEDFLEQMHEDVGIVGSSICTLDEDFRHSIAYQNRFGGQSPYSHVQTMAYVLPKAVLEKLIADGFYQEDRDTSKSLAIENYEIHLSQLVLQQGKNLRCLLPELNHIDYRQPHSNPNPTSTIGDPNEVLGYFGRSVHPYEVIFVKTNRHLYTEGYLARLTYSMIQAKDVSGPFSIDAVGAMLGESVADYLSRIEKMALSKEGVSDFSYLPGDLENREKLKLAQEQADADRALLNNLLQSTSWKITRPLRWLKDLLS
jgi:hypothetical protein